MGLVHGSCWPDAEEPGSKHDLKGKGATREMATSGFSYGKCKGNTTLPRSWNDVGPSRDLWNDVGEVSEQNGVGPTLNGVGTTSEQSVGAFA